MKKWSKRLVSALLMVVLMLTMFPFSLGVNGASSNIAYAVENGYIYFDPSTGTIVDCDQSVTKADIPAQIGGVWVKNIGDSAFAGCNKLKEVSTQTYISIIGNYAFKGCAKLVDVCIWGAVYAHKYSSVSSIESDIKNSASGTCYWIGHSAFKGCSSLENISLFSGVTYLGTCAFEQCSSLISVVLPDKLEVIKDYTFSECSSLSDINIPDSVYKIEAMAFHACFSLKTIEINEGVKTIDRQAFSVCGIKNVNIPKSIKRIELATFEFCYALKNVYISDGVEYIAEAAFRNSGVEKITIPSTVKDVGNYAFEYCNKLTDVFYSGTKEEWDKIAIGEGNSELKNATIHYNSAAPNDPGQSSDDVEIIEQIHQFQNWDIFTNTVYFRDGTSYKLSDTYGSVNIEDLLDNWVACTICKDSKKGNYITDMEKITSEIVVDISMDKSEIFYKDNDLSFDGENYEGKSAFEIPYHVTIENRISHSVSAETLKAMQADDSPLNVEITDVSVIIPNEFNFGMFGGGKLDWDGPITLHANERWEENKNTYIRAEGDFSPSAKHNEYEMHLSVQTSSGNKTDHAVFTVEDVSGNIEISEDLPQNWIEEVLKTIHDLGDVDITVQNAGFKTYFDKNTYDDICRIISLWKTAKDSELVQNASGSMPKYLEIECKMGNNARGHKGHNATLYFWTEDTGLGLSYIHYMLVDTDTKSKIARDGVFSFSVQSYGVAQKLSEKLQESYQETWENFFAELAKSGINGVATGVGLFGPSKMEYLNSLLSVLKDFDSVCEAIEEFKGFAEFGYGDILKTEISALTVTGRSMESDLKKLGIACPVNVFVYNSQGELCAAVENNVVTEETSAVFVDVTGEQKTVWLSDEDYTVEFVSTDTGSMDYTIEEYKNGMISRTLAFDDVPLSKGISYEGDVPVDLDISATNYVLTSNTGKVIYADRDYSENDPPSFNLPFTDISSSDWFFEKVQYVYENNIMVGVSNTKFDPYATLDRAQAVQILYNLEGQPRVTGSTSFSDVAGHWAIQAIQWASEEGIAAGDGDGTFRPNDSITREEFAQMLYNYSRYKWYDISASGDLAKFQDTDKVSDWAITAIKWANGHGLINGHDDGTIDPQGPAQRCQAASILCQYNQAIKKH